MFVCVDFCGLNGSSFLYIRPMRLDNPLFPYAKLTVASLNPELVSVRVTTQNVRIEAPKEFSASTYPDTFHVRPVIFLAVMFV